MDSPDRPPKPNDFGGTCDWGWCCRPFHSWRWAADLNVWLPVCSNHRDRNDPARWWPQWTDTGEANFATVLCVLIIAFTAFQIAQLIWVCP